MCILLLSTAHPDYPLILLSNRDEFLHRPTQRATYWEPPYEHVFSGRDLARPEKGKLSPLWLHTFPAGTWLGVSKQGRLAILTNYREPSSAMAIGEKSRGAMITSFLCSPDPVETPIRDWIHKVLETGEMKGVGGFSMLCGTLRPNGENLKELAVISNRTIHRDNGLETKAQWIGSKKGETRGLSNTLLDQPWPKVEMGEKLLAEVVQKSVEEGVSEDELLERCFQVLSHNTLPLITADDTYETEMDALRLSIFIPPFDAASEHATTPNGHRARTPEDSQKQSPRAEDIASGKPEEELKKWRKSPRLYGTAQQSVILVDKKGRLKYVERTLYAQDASPLDKKDQEVVTEFQIEGWRSEA
ncbi:NRDE protein-domain-containing protein [Sphaerosporella brunnea]|uniref:NRDE protein-domain-containing protein n=1 Tax=Sphaerosporella brunnea TaxID=1250544 RepID=A0A5J5EPN6_9PEZI|nr:NRDE protein-domain-containing protein [Sphaerosporella brunnea]